MKFNQTTMTTTLNDLRLKLASTSDKSSANLPPTEDAFLQHILRCKVQLQIWMNSHDPQPNLWNPINNGWSLQEGSLRPVMITMPPAPEELRNITHLYCKDSNCTLSRKCPCLAACMPCISICGCFEGHCLNTCYQENEKVVQED